MLAFWNGVANVSIHGLLELVGLCRLPEGWNSSPITTFC